MNALAFGLPGGPARAGRGRLRGGGVRVGRRLPRVNALAFGLPGGPARARRGRLRGGGVRVGRRLPRVNALALGLPGGPARPRRGQLRVGGVLGRRLPRGRGRSRGLPRGRAIPGMPLGILAGLLRVAGAGLLPRVDALALRLLPGGRAGAICGLRGHGLRRHSAVAGTVTGPVANALASVLTGAVIGSGVRLTGRGQGEGLVAGAARRGKVPGVSRRPVAARRSGIAGHSGVSGGGGRRAVRRNGPEPVRALRVVVRRFRRPETAG
ncbi:hypothetical protein AB0C14_09460 [Microbispora hainanensis]|uniref:hypothetical protein n=1 Tax=Microbispora hainanensis TaxID=568844 RepID=UPI0033F2D33F